MSAGASQPGGDEGALQAGPVWRGKLFGNGKVPSFGVARTRNLHTDCAFAERWRKHVPVGVVSATAAAFGVEGAPIPSRAPPLYSGAARGPAGGKQSDASPAKSRVNRIF